MLNLLLHKQLLELALQRKCNFKILIFITKKFFGSVAPVFSFKSEEDVITIANDTPYGLAAYFYGKDNTIIWRVAEALEFGVVGSDIGMVSTL